MTEKLRRNSSVKFYHHCPKDTDNRNIHRGTAKATEAMAFKLCRQAEKNWRRLKGFEKLDLVAKDMKFENGVLKEVA